MRKQKKSEELLLILAPYAPAINGLILWLIQMLKDHFK